jgi:hypothetical protein
VHTHMYAISRDGQGQNSSDNFLSLLASAVRIYFFGPPVLCVVEKIYTHSTSKSALGWLANKGERWMPRLEKAMKDVA